jgi:hypothetical protein
MLAGTAGVVVRVAAAFGALAMAVTFWELGRTLLPTLGVLSQPSAACVARSDPAAAVSCPVCVACPTCAAGLEKKETRGPSRPLVAELIRDHTDDLVGQKLCPVAGPVMFGASLVVNDKIVTVVRVKSPARILRCTFTLGYAAENCAFLPNNNELEDP